MDINSLIEDVFKFTLNKNYSKKEQLLVLAESDPDGLTLSNLEYFLFERLQLNPQEYILIPSNTSDSSSAETKDVITYLFESFIRNEVYKTSNPEAFNVINGLILRNASTALQQPVLFDHLAGGQDLSKQLIDVFRSTDEENLETLSSDFLSLSLLQALQDDSDKIENFKSVTNILNKCFSECMKTIKKASMINLEKWVIPFLLTFVTNKLMGEELGLILLKYSTPDANQVGIKYAESLLGQLLSLSICPKHNNGPYEFYENLQNTNMQSLSNLSSTLWNYLSMHLDAVHKIFKGFLLIGGIVKSNMLDWISNAIHSNVKRGQIWNSQSSMVLGNYTTAPDSFMIGLAGILLRLSQPIAAKPQLKVLIADPTYQAVTMDQRIAKEVHMINVDKETCLLPEDLTIERTTADKFNFVTECLFMTHKAIDLGYRVCIEKVMRMNREIQRLHSAYQDAIGGHGGSGSSIAENLLQQLSANSQQFLCLQNLILDPTNSKLLLGLYDATSIWLNQLARIEKIELRNAAVGFAPHILEPIHFPIANETPVLLKYVPEFFIENIVGFLQFSRVFGVQDIQFDLDARTSIFTMILIFMGSDKRAKNPHLRAHLAEGLESFLPKENRYGSYQENGRKLFESHEHRLFIVENLLNVFVSIEMTGQSVQFEQKFNYRRPIYNLLDYLWKIPEQRECFKKLATIAEETIDAVEAPILLRFINLLMNDAIFLLDESLNNLQQIRTMEEARDRDEWNSLPSNELRQNQQNLQHLGMLARFNNILGRDTINMLNLLTSETKGIFCHNTMVERIASMLNYFLLQLVGPKSKNFKVKDKKEFEFDPASTVRQICQIYLNLKDCQEFCLAVSQDGRSYSSQLFEFAERVLIRIAAGNLITEIAEFSQMVNQIDQQHKEDEEALTNAPEEFLDPIMGTLMLDPVILPSSRITLDRVTISRHLLSDSTDPYNRAPLTMQDLTPNEELKGKIADWITEKRRAYSESKKNPKNV